MRIFLVSHTRNEAELDGYKVIGVFSSKQKAEAAIKSLKDQPGFAEYPSNFHVDGYDVDKIFWSGGFG
jgi:hypothetical protein